MIDELPAHTPSVTVGIATDDANSSEPSDGCHLATVVSGGGGFDKDEKIYFDGDPSQMVALGGVSSGATGKGDPINILNPYIALNFSIALEGAFPPRN
jgi:microcystin-dependent protein